LTACTFDESDEGADDQRAVDAVQAVPTQKVEGVYRRGIHAELATQLLDQPLVLTEWCR
jgi:hypothetical protein